MRTRNLVRRLLIALAVALVAWLAYGPLFAWSPMTPGFRSAESAHAVVRYRAEHGFRISITDLDAALVRLQGDVGLEFTAPARFLLCDDWQDFRRFTPWLQVSHGIGAITLPIGLMTYVTPLVRTRDDLLPFMVHEAAHSLLYQHASIRHRLEMERQAWFVEGVGVRFGNPGAYMNWTEWRGAGSASDITTAIAGEPGRNRRTTGGARFSYSTFGYFIGYLTSQFGADRFHQFASSYVKDPGAHREDFRRIFGVPLEDAVRTFANLPAEPR